MKSGFIVYMYFEGFFIYKVRVMQMNNTSYYKYVSHAVFGKFYMTNSLVKMLKVLTYPG